MKTSLFHQLKGKLIVSCQALPNEPLYVVEQSIMYLMARAAKRAGCAAIRTNSARDVVAIKAETGLPVIGLIKQAYEGYEPYITPTMQEIDALVQAGADIVAADCTIGKRQNAASASDYIAQIKKKYPDLMLMADISTYAEGFAAWKAGADLIGTTMSGYTPWSEKLPGPDYELVRRLAAELPIPVIGEGRIHTPEQAVEMLSCGAHAVVVGGAITRPLEIATRFVQAIEGR